MFGYFGRNDPDTVLNIEFRPPLFIFSSVVAAGLMQFCPLNVSFQAEDVNRTLETGRKPLHIVADFGQKEVMEFLISTGANVNVGAAADITHAHWLK